MDNRMYTRVDLRHCLLKYARFAAGCLVLLCMNGSSDKVEHYAAPQNSSYDNTSRIVSNQSVSDNSTIANEMWELRSQRGVSRNQILSLRKIGNKGKTSCISALLLQQFLLKVQTSFLARFNYYGDLF